jgi:hypothetical protein
LVCFEFAIDANRWFLIIKRGNFFVAQLTDHGIAEFIPSARIVPCVAFDNPLGGCDGFVIVAGFEIDDSFF